MERGVARSRRTILGSPPTPRRIALIADFGGTSAPTVLFECQGLLGDSAESGEERESIASDAQRSAGADDSEGDSGVVCMATQQGGAEIRTDDKAPCLTAAAEMSGNNQPVICLQGNGIDRADTAGCNGKRWNEQTCYTLNTIDRPAVVYEPKSLLDENWSEADTKNALRAEASKSSHAVVQEVYDARGNGDGNTAPTITGDHENRVTDYTSVVVERSVLMDAYQHHGYREGETCGTLTAGQNDSIRGDTPVIIGFRQGSFGGYVEGEVGTLKASGGDLGGGMETLITETNLNNVVRVKEDDLIAAGTQSPILRLLCKTYGAQAVVEWGIAVVAALQQTEVLRQGLHEESNACEAENRYKLDDRSLPCPSVVADWMLRDMRAKSECGCSPQRQQSAEQRDQQSATAAPVLSLESTQRCEEMFDTWQKSQRIGLLRQALSEIQEIRRSACCEKERRRYIVRRLTPLEAERLQGFQDGWTDIGEWTDSKGKMHKTTDSARYKALGNSIAIPPWTFVLSNLILWCGADVTMASLFDGIGGFPLIWNRLGGETLWASEIEEFPIAVTKLHFQEETQ